MYGPAASSWVVKRPFSPVARDVSSAWLSQTTIAFATPAVLPSSCTKPMIFRRAGGEGGAAWTVGTGRSTTSIAQPAPM